MKEVFVRELDGDEILSYTDFDIISVGVIIRMSETSEVLVPWHNVEQITSTERGYFATLPL